MNRVLLLLLLFLGAPLWAHTGHDHGHWSADLLHYSFYFSILLCCIGMLAYLVSLLSECRSNGECPSSTQHK